MGRKQLKGKEPQQKAGRLSLAASSWADTLSKYPSFSLHFLQKKWGLEKASKDDSHKLLEKLKVLSQLPLSDLRSTRVGKRQGFEPIPTDQLRAALPERFSSEKRIYICRYGGKERFAGFFIENIFAILYIDPNHELIPS